MTLNSPYPLPPNLTIYPHQIGGQGAMFEKKDTILCDPFGNIFKPAQCTSEIEVNRTSSKARREAEFYRLLFTSPAPELVGLRRFVPAFRGVFKLLEEEEEKSSTTTLKRVQRPDNDAIFSTKLLNDGRGCCSASSKEQQAYLAMSDALAGLRQPCVMDCKVGGVTHEPGASSAKIAIERAKYVHRERLGFMITAMKLFDAGSCYRNFDWFYGNSLTPDSVYSGGVRLFFEPAVDKLHRYLVLFLVEQFIQRLHELESWFLEQTSFSFYATSLLLAYDAASHAASDGAPLTEPTVVVRLIDFAHVVSSPSGKDENFLFGLRNLIHLFEKFQKELHFDGTSNRNGYFLDDRMLLPTQVTLQNIYVSDEEFDDIVAFNASFIRAIKQK